MSKRIKKTEAKFDAKGYQTGKPHLLDEPIDFKAFEKTPVLSREQEIALGLPSPEELAGGRPQTKITLAVDDDALAFFKGEAKRLGTSYQRMMRNLLTSYVSIRTRPRPRSTKVR